MTDRTSPAFIAACEALNNAPQCPELGAEIALAEAIAAYEKALWQPIETAPKDKTPFLLWNGAGMPAVWWYPMLGAFIDGSEDCYGDYVTFEGTHWRPLPTPPEEV